MQDGYGKTDRENQPESHHLSMAHHEGYGKGAGLVLMVVVPNRLDWRKPR
jgi:hypothetical protein